MKKMIIIICAFITTLIITGCDYNDDSDKLKLTKLLALQKQKTEKMVTYDSFDKIINYTIITNDLNGNLLKSEFFNNPGNDGKWFTLDDDILMTIYEYDGNGKCIKGYYYHNNTLQNISKNIFNSDGYKIKMNMYDANGIILISYTTYEYDSDGNLLKEITYDKDNNITFCYTIEYNLNKKVKTSYYSDNEITLMYYNIYEYDNNIIKIINTYNNIGKFLRCTLIDYY